MSINAAIKSRILLGSVFFTLSVVSGLAACGGKGEVTPPTTPPPSDSVNITLTATSTNLAYNDDTDVTWSSTGASSCTSTGGGGTDTSGTFNTGPLSATTTYTVTCFDASGGGASEDLTITVLPSTITAFTGISGSSPVTVTSANNLTNGAWITISGTTNYDNSYIVSDVTPTSFTIPTNFIANDATGTWQLAGGMIAGCFPTGSAQALDAITLSINASRFSGVAPLSVFFDATETTSNSTSRPFHELEYQWDDGSGNGFGDPGSGNWGDQDTGSGGTDANTSRNIASGPVASHIYERPGVYTATLRISDGTNTVTSKCAQIVVHDPDDVFSGNNTICFANAAPFTDCPAGATQVISSNFSTSISSYQATGRRLLFKRGDNFTASTSGIIDKTGPGIVGAFGPVTAPKPKVRMTGSSAILQISSPTSPGIKDWRIMDLDLDGMSNPSSSVAGISAGGGINQLLALRLNIHDIFRGISGDVLGLDWSNSHGNPGHTIFDEWTIADSTILPIVGGCSGCDWRIYVAGKRISIQGNFLDNMDTGGSHVIRNNTISKGVIESNTIARAGATQHAIKLHAWGWGAVGVANPTGAGTYTEQVVISDNKIIGGVNPWTVSIGPQNQATDERIRDVIVERNWFTSGAGTQVALLFSSISSTARNNIIDMSNADYHTGISIARRGIEPSPNDVKVYNNTLYSGSTGNFVGASIGETATNVTIINNLGWATSATNPVMIFGTGASGFVQSNNSTGEQIKSTSPDWVSSTPNTPPDYKLTPSSYALGAGISVPVYSDFFLNNRATHDLGATMQ